MFVKDNSIECGFMESIINRISNLQDNMKKLF